MGLIADYIWYRSGKNKGRRDASIDIDLMIDELIEPCEHCGNMAMQHSQDGRMLCPRYD